MSNTPKVWKIIPLALPPVQQLGPLQHVRDVLAVEGLEDHVVGLHPQGLDRELGVRGREDDDDVAAQLAQLARELDAVHARHVDVEQGKVHLVAPRVGHRLVRVRELAHDLKVRHVPALELEQLQVEQHIVHQDRFHRRCSF
jgi:hypothetical protein